MKRYTILAMLLSWLALAAASQNVEPVTFDGDGTDASPYLIRCADDLMKLVRATSDERRDFAGEHFLVTADIDLAGIVMPYPVGRNAELPFNGTLDGGGHRIMNWTHNEQSGCGGLVAYLGARGVIRNLAIDASCVLNSTGCFAPFAYSAAGLVENCANFAKVLSPTGFQAGIAYEVKTGGAIINCYNEGDIATLAPNAAHSAGIAVLNSGKIVACQNAGSLSALAGNTIYFGGITAENSGTITDCLSTGAIAATTAFGGITAIANPGSSITNSICTAVLIAGGDLGGVGAVAGVANGDSVKYDNVVYDKQFTIYENIHAPGILPRTTAQLADDYWHPSDYWCHLPGRYPQIMQYCHESAAKLTSLPLLMPEDTDLRNVAGGLRLYNTEAVKWSLHCDNDAFAITQDSVVVNSLEHYTKATLVGQRYSTVRRIPLGLLGTCFTGEGTETSPFLINTPADLVALSSEVNTSHQNYAGVVFAITDDLDMAGIDFVPIAVGANTTFEGTIVGNGHTISNLTINQPNADNVGLIGNMGRGTLSDLKIASGTVKGRDCTGAFAGRSTGQLLRLTNYAEVNGCVNAGGIAGNMPSDKQGPSDTTLLIKHCLNNGKVTATTANAGGLAGAAGVITIEGCANTGDIVCSAETPKTGQAGAGGLVGLGNPTIRNSFNSGYVLARGMAGGFIGAVADIGKPAYISLSISTGAVEGFTVPGTVGALVGVKTGDLKCSEVYYDMQIDTLAAVAGEAFEGVTPMLTANLLSVIPNRQWEPKSGKCYPIPYNISRDSTLIAHSHPILLQPNENRYRVTAAFHVPTLEGFHWNMPKVLSQWGDKVYIQANYKGSCMVEASDRLRHHTRTYHVHFDCYDLQADVDGDGKEDIGDLNGIINTVLGKNTDPYEHDRSDVNRNGNIDIADINIMINILLSKTVPGE